MFLEKLIWSVFLMIFFQCSVEWQTRCLKKSFKYSMFILLLWKEIIWKSSFIYSMCTLLWWKQIIFIMTRPLKTVNWIERKSFLLGKSTLSKTDIFLKYWQGWPLVCLVYFHVTLIFHLNQQLLFITEDPAELRASL